MDPWTAAVALLALLGGGFLIQRAGRRVTQTFVPTPYRGAVRLGPSLPWRLRSATVFTWALAVFTWFHRVPAVTSLGFELLWTAGEGVLAVALVAAVLRRSAVAGTAAAAVLVSLLRWLVEVGVCAHRAFDVPVAFAVESGAYTAATVLAALWVVRSADDASPGRDDR